MYLWVDSQGVSLFFYFAFSASISKGWNLAFIICTSTKSWKKSIHQRHQIQTTDADTRAANTKEEIITSERQSERFRHTALNDLFGRLRNSYYCCEWSLLSHHAHLIEWQRFLRGQKGPPSTRHLAMWAACQLRHSCEVFHSKKKMIRPSTDKEMATSPGDGLEEKKIWISDVPFWT